MPQSALTSHDVLTAQQPSWSSPELDTRHSNQKRRVCNECRQQKLKCDLDNAAVTTCSRCVKFDLECRVDKTFHRQRRRKRDLDLEKELLDLKQQLATYEKTDPQQSSHDTALQTPPPDGPKCVRDVIQATSWPRSISRQSNQVAADHPSRSFSVIVTTYRT